MRRPRPLPRRRMPRLPRVLEAQEQLNICNMARSLGGKAYVIGTKRSKRDYSHGTHQTPGIADLWLDLPTPRVREFPRLLAAAGVTPEQLSGPIGLWWETKRQGEERTDDQVEFGDRCVANGTPYGWGTYDTFLKWLIARRYLLPDQVGAHHVDGGRRDG